MAILSSKQVLQEKKTIDSNAITALTLTFKALTDVSCLSDFKNLERLDLTLNNLSSLEDLKMSVNLKWLSVVQNKLQSLKGIEGLTKLTVLNAGKNKLKSMDEVTSLVSLRALILNDNEIAFIPRLDQMKELNTLVLSRNPIQEIGESMAKLKLISKISLSNCQIQTIGSSLKSCTELKELRLAHNGITILPDELARNLRILNLDLGNNSIGRWSNLKVLSSLVNLRNLNLQGNPIAEKEKLAKKIKKLVPSVQIYNAKPIEKIIDYEKGGKIDDSSADLGNMLEVKKGKHLDRSVGNSSLQHHAVGPSKDIDVDGTGDFAVEKKLEVKRKKTDIESPKKARKHKRLEDVKQCDTNSNDEGKSSKKKSADKMEFSKNPKNVTFDDGEIPFSDLFTFDIAENAKNHIESMKQLKQGTVGEVVTFPKNKRKIKKENVGASALQVLVSGHDIGLGGPSAWDN